MHAEPTAPPHPEKTAAVGKSATCRRQAVPPAVRSVPQAPIRAAVARRGIASVPRETPQSSGSRRRLRLRASGFPPKHLLEADSPRNRHSVGCLRPRHHPNGGHSEVPSERTIRSTSGRCRRRKGKHAAATSDGRSPEVHSRAPCACRSHQGCGADRWPSTVADYWALP